MESDDMRDALERSGTYQSVVPSEKTLFVKPPGTAVLSQLKHSIHFLSCLPVLLEADQVGSVFRRLDVICFKIRCRSSHCSE